MEIKDNVWDMVKVQTEQLETLSEELAALRADFQARTTALQLKLTSTSSTLSSLMGIATQHAGKSE